MNSHARIESCEACESKAESSARKWSTDGAERRYKQIRDDNRIQINIPLSGIERMIRDAQPISHNYASNDCDVVAAVNS